MNAGVLGVPASSRPLSTIDDRLDSMQESGHEVRTVVDVREQTTLDGDTAAVEGRVLYEEVEDTEHVRVEDGSIKVSDTRERVQQWANVCGAPATDGHDGFMLVDSSSAVFAFEIAGDTLLEPAEIALAEFVDEHDPFTVGTAGSPAVGPIDSVTAHGSDVLEDEDIGVGEHMRDSIRAGHLSQVRVRYESDWGLVRCYLAASGYVDVYEPDLETEEFLELVASDVLPFARGGDA